VNKKEAKKTLIPLCHAAETTTDPVYKNFLRAAARGGLFFKKALLS
jgi:hypothetical protein